MWKLSGHMDGIEPSDIRKWTVIIESLGGINMAQGTCFIEPAPYFDRLCDAARATMRLGRDKTGYNTYSPAAGVRPLLEALAKKSSEFNHIAADPDPQTGTLVVTNGATGAMNCALHALLDPGDEVVVFEPFYNYHVKSIQMQGGRAVYVPLHRPDWSFDPDELEAAVTPRTRAVIVNTPNNPTGKVFTRDELLQVGRICIRHGIPLISDEVYEFITFDGTEHVSPGSLEELKEHTITISAFSKTLAITGWRIGYAIAPPDLCHRMKIANEMNYVCAPTPLQHAVAELVNDWTVFLALKEGYAKKRRLLCEALTELGLPPSVPRGAYYVLADCSRFGLADSSEINRYLIDTFRISGVPGGAFFRDPAGCQYVRFCFAIPDAELCQLQDLKSP